MVKGRKSAKKSSALKTAEKKREASKKNGTYVGAKKMMSDLTKKGYSKAYAGAIIGDAARAKYGKKGAAALSAAGRKKGKK